MVEDSESYFLAQENKKNSKKGLTTSTPCAIIKVQRGKESKTMRIITGTIFTISIIACAWFAVSYIDILAHNLSSGTLASWNFFGMLLD